MLTRSVFVSKSILSAEGLVAGQSQCCFLFNITIQNMLENKLEISWLHERHGFILTFDRKFSFDKMQFKSIKVLKIFWGSSPRYLIN